MQPADPLLRSVARPVPPGPYRVVYDCGPANHQVIDLGAKTRTTSGTPAPVVSNLSDAMSSMIADTVTRVLAGGPYRAEPGPCSLSIEIETGGRGAVFTIEKSAHQEKDAVSDLVRVFVP